MGKLYFHYKNKPYKYLGTVKHSETLEDLALYETLYKNDLGRMWVRPKDMFFERVVVDGVEQDRFTPVEIEVEEFVNAGAGELGLIESVYAEVFAPKPGGGQGGDQGALSERVLRKIIPGQTVHLVVARIRGEVVGFKLAYARSQELLLSWIGGVGLKWRGLGIASLLMKAQHEWAAVQGFREIETRTQSNYAEMLALNLKFGFEIVGTIAVETEGLPPTSAVKVILRKSLASRL